MTRTGFVKEKKDDRLLVCFERPDACAGCRGCAKGILPKKELVTVFGDAQVGDVVEVQLPESQMLKATLLAYALPLFLFLLSLGVAYACGFSDGIGVILALAGLILGLGGARAVERRLRSLPAWRPIVTAVHPRDIQLKERE